MTQMRGPSVNKWYKKIDKKQDEYYQVLYFLEREELYNLKVHALKGKNNVVLGSITGGGPLMTERAVVPQIYQNVREILLLSE